MATRVIQAEINAAGRTFAIVASKWNSGFVDKLIEGALAAFSEFGASQSDIEVVRVPGSFEIPFMAKQLAETGKYDGIITVGVLLKGDTDHYRLIAEELAAGISRVMFETNVPVTFGVITADSIDKVAARSVGGEVNKGWESAVAAIEMVDLCNKVKANGS